MIVTAPFLLSCAFYTTRFKQNITQYTISLLQNRLNTTRKKRISKNAAPPHFPFMKIFKNKHEFLKRFVRKFCEKRLDKREENSKNKKRKEEKLIKSKKNNQKENTKDVVWYKDSYSCSLRTIGSSYNLWLFARVYAYVYIRVYTYIPLGIFLSYSLSIFTWIKVFIQIYLYIYLDRYISVSRYM